MKSIAAIALGLLAGVGLTGVLDRLWPSCPSVACVVFTVGLAMVLAALWPAPRKTRSGVKW